eukprot:CAMPEP_0202478670 /NCGR_PEP_ID=MMETSP1360-20130828/94581_1 /ASSEMBLY_ACC=CAM_ASM_000848 /TAXON_ID=515479 /ORGANISM="Licmophora paradoxa, Strain CCMP2313" /LENGTH=159 /DNA_ID=CAMNT_0049105957 /DNA_START=92 /DNA_END=571 /DNA_ORIENTATION=+
MRGSNGRSSSFLDSFSLSVSESESVPSPEGLEGSLNDNPLPALAISFDIPSIRLRDPRLDIFKACSARWLYALLLVIGRWNFLVTDTSLLSGAFCAAKEILGLGLKTLQLEAAVFLDEVTTVGMEESGLFRLPLGPKDEEEKERLRPTNMVKEGEKLIL